jgi:hypothetical protein
MSGTAARTGVPRTSQAAAANSVQEAITKPWRTQPEPGPGWMTR